MADRLLAALVLGVVVSLLAPQTSNAQSRGDREKEKAADVVKWELRKLDQDPFKLIKVTPNSRTGEVDFLLELTREAKPSELFDWEQRGGPVMFSFLDADGVVLQMAKPRWEGALLPKQGTRMRLVLRLPNENLLAATYTIKAE